MAVDETRGVVPIILRVRLDIEVGFQYKLGIVHVIGADWRVLGVLEGSTDIWIY
jgi:hypothetical protein